MVPINTPLTRDAAKKLMALDAQDKEILTYEKLDEWYTAWGGRCYVSFSGGKDSTDLVCAVDCRNFREGGEINGTLQAKESGGQSLNLNNTVRQNMVVRRLTPLECTRLQGYPDGWVDIGDWTDERCKKHKDADSPKYKALGNSIALPFWDWMLRRMARYLPEGATLGSLFDGIGGFPLIWERIHGKGTARWASEIEQFPIAVTKKWFGEE